MQVGDRWLVVSSCGGISDSRMRDKVRRHLSILGVALY